MGWRLLLWTLAAWTAGCQARREAPKAPALAFVGALEGTLEPCGCTSVPLGGLDYLAGALRALQQEYAVATVVFGRTFTSDASPAQTRTSQDVLRGQVVEDFLHQLAPTVTLTEAQGSKSATEMVQVGGTRVGLVRLEAPVPGVSPTDVRAHAARLREQGAQLVVGVWVEDSSLLPHAGLLQGCQDVMDIVVQSGPSGRALPERIGGVPVVTTGNHGEQLAVVYLRGEGQSRYTYFDGGAGERTALTAQAQQLQDALQSLPPGPAHTARQERLQSIQQSLAAPPPTAPTTPNWQLQLVPITRRPGDSRPPWAQALLRRFNEGLCHEARMADANLVCPTLPPQAPRYVGSATCQGCHAAAFTAYATSRHAHAWATLEAAGKTCDLSCIGCHTVGYNQPGGFCRLQDAAPYQNVGCENCHGPGSLHVVRPQTRDAWGPAFARSPGEAICRTCHVPSHSDQFDFATYRARIVVPGHGLPVVPP